MLPSTQKTLFSYLSIIAFPAWMVILTFPLITRSDWYEWTELNQSIIYYHVSGIIVFSLLILLYRPLLVFQCALFRNGDLTKIILNLFFVLLVLLSVFSLDPITSISYSFATYFVILLFSRLWLEPWLGIRFGLLISGISVFGLLGFAILIHGAPENRWIGGIQPNQFSNFALMAMLALFFQGKKTRLVAYALALSAALLVNSRGAILSVLVFGVCYVTLALVGRLTVIRTMMMAGFASVIFVALALSLLLGFGGSIWDWVIMTTAVYDPDRGFGSGLTGRMQNLPFILEMIAEKPFFGYGFRVEKTLPTLSAPTAYLRLFIQVGIIPGLLFIFAMITQVQRMAVLSIRWLKFDEEKANIFRVIASGIVLVMVNGLVEGTMINIGFPLSLLFLFLLVAPNRLLFSDNRAANLSKQAA